MILQTIPDYTTIVNAASKIGVLEAVLIFVVFVLSIVVVTLLRLLSNLQKSQSSLAEKAFDIMLSKYIDRPNHELGKTTNSIETNENGK